jgi:hypothetical protein
MPEERGWPRLSASGALAAAPASIPNTAVRILPVIAVDPEVYTLDCMTFDSETQNDSTGNDYMVLTASTSGIFSLGCPVKKSRTSPRKIGESIRAQAHARAQPFERSCKKL